MECFDKIVVDDPTCCSQHGGVDFCGVLVWRMGGGLTDTSDESRTDKVSL